jgi:hypothetical protein
MQPDGLEENTLINLMPGFSCGKVKMAGHFADPKNPLFAKVTETGE